MLFRLIITLIIFEIFINNILQKYLNAFIVIYINNILVCLVIKKEYLLYI